MSRSASAGQRRLVTLTSAAAADFDTASKHDAITQPECRALASISPE